ncbi:ATP phosphoribosyltransferase [Microlunatus elymi]|nr:ATP phosphoribosyltransferase [Microlunatus elymi]
MTIGLPNTGRLMSEVLASCPSVLGQFQGNRRLVARIGDFRILLARSTDLPMLVTEAVCDAVVTGRDYVWEAGLGEVLHEAWNYGYQKNELCLIGRPGESYVTTDALRVVSQYPNLADKFVRPVYPNATVRPISGAAEMYLREGLADVAVDAVMTGETLADNGLVAITSYLESYAALYTLPGIADETLSQIYDLLRIGTIS